jgi:threonine dehydrogenase-like Zn-dependent dehydrogenase
LLCPARLELDRRRERKRSHPGRSPIAGRPLKAVNCKDAQLAVVERPTPTPAKGQVLIDVLRCGICGSDLHARHHCDELAEMMSESGYDAFMRSDQEVILGHEFCGEIVEHGPGCRKASPTGTPVVAMPLLRRGKDVHVIGLSTAAPGAYAEQLVVEESLAVPVPNGLSPELAALTEPLAVGWHAVRRGEVKKGTVAVVIGCGPIGLSVICLLKANGVRTVVASDFSAGRRALATACGADVVVDPEGESPFAPGADHRHLHTVPEALDKAVGAVENLRRLPVSWWRIWRAAEALGIKPKSPVIFECVGVPGVIDGIIAGAPLFSRVVVVGVCMGADRIRPAMAINKEIDLRFVVGYTPLEFRDTLHMIAEGKVNAAPMVTGIVGLPGVDEAFTALADPDAHAKILIDPKSSAVEPAGAALA